MKTRRVIAAVAAAGVLSVAAACGVTAASTDTTSSGTSTGGTTSQSQSGGRGPGGGGAEVSSVNTEAELVALIQEAYGDAGLDLHRGHQPVQDVLDAVLTISHDELHVRMNAGQNLAAVAEDLGVDPQTLIDALVASWSPAVDNALAAGAITEAEAQAYTAALEEAFTFRVTWDGQAATPTFTGLEA